MQLGLTIPLQKYLKRKAPPYGGDSDLFYCWELHTILLQGARSLVAVNASNRFSLVLCGMQAADWDDFPSRFSEGLKTALDEAEVPAWQIEAYFQRAGKIRITKTHGRRPVASLNLADDFLWGIPVPVDETQLYQSVHTQELNRVVCMAAGFPSRGRPLDFWMQDMRRTGIAGERNLGIDRDDRQLGDVCLGEHESGHGNAGQQEKIVETDHAGHNGSTGGRETAGILENGKTVCSCRWKNCRRFGDCKACVAYHKAHDKHPLPSCRRKSGRRPKNG